MKGNIQVSYVIRILAGGYLLYIAVPILQRGINGEIESNPALFIGASIIFIVADCSLREPVCIVSLQAKICSPGNR